jgi:hypothetical protein
VLRYPAQRLEEHWRNLRPGDKQLGIDHHDRCSRDLTEPSNKAVKLRRGPSRF